MTTEYGRHPFFICYTILCFKMSQNNILLDTNNVKVTYVHRTVNVTQSFIL